MNVTTQCNGKCCSWVFTDLTSQDFSNLTSMMTFRQCLKGDLIVTEGTYTLGLFVVCECQVKMVQKACNSGKRQLLKIVGPVELLGECTLFNSQGKYSSSFKTESRCRLAFIHRGHLRNYLAKKPLLYRKFLEKISQELKVTPQKLTETSYQTVDTRISGLLLQMAVKAGGTDNSKIKLDFNLSRDELAQMTGVTKEQPYAPFRAKKKVIKSRS